MVLVVAHDEWFMSWWTKYILEIFSPLLRNVLVENESSRRRAYILVERKEYDNVQLQSIALNCFLLVRICGFRFIGAGLENRFR